jgi:hypothetical protein
MSFQIRPKLRSQLPQALAALIVAAASTGAVADELTTPPIPSASQQANVPARGMSMEKVEAQFGSPSERLPAVGEPPITRWKYPGFEVYFEHHLVIHTVVGS